MVAPLIVGAARVAGGAARTAGTKASQKRAASSYKRIQESTRIKAVANNSQYDPISLRAQQQVRQQRAADSPSQAAQRVLRSGRVPNIQNKLLTKLPDTSLTRKVLALRASIMLIAAATGLWFIQMFFAFIGLGFIGLETIPLVDIIIPGVEITLISVAITGSIGIIAMAITAIGYIAQGVSCLKDWRMVLGFMVCLAFYFPIFLNFFPWAIVWMCIVVVLQKKE